MCTAFENAKFGDRVFSHTFGWGTIYETDKNAYCPIQVTFDTTDESFTVEGFYRKHVPIQCLFWGECGIEAPTKPPAMKLIHGVEVPDISFHPTEAGTRYHHPDIAHFSMFASATYWDNSYPNEYHSVNNLCYPYTEEGKTAAIMHAKAMLGIKE